MRPYLKVIFINILTSLFLIASIELLIFFGLKNPSIIPHFLLNTYRALYQSYDRNIIQVTDCAQYDSALFYTLKPGMCTFQNREFAVKNYINSSGLRDNESSLIEPEIIVLGDSYAMGWGVDQSEAFPQVLEQHSNKKILNAGISSFGTAREVKLLQKLDIKSLRTLVIQYHSNDYEENWESQKKQYKLPISNEMSYDSLKAYIEDRNKYYPLKFFYQMSKTIALNYIRPGSVKAIADSAEAKLFLDILINAPFKKDSLQIIVFKVDNYDKLNNNFAEAINTLMLQPKYTSLNIKALLLNNLLTPEDYFLLDDHINKDGHKKIALLINNSLK